MFFLWALVAFSGFLGLWAVFGERLTSRAERATPLARREVALAVASAALALIGTTFAVLVAIDNATVEEINCVQALNPDTGEHELSCQETGGLDWLPRWIRGDRKRVNR